MASVCIGPMWRRFTLVAALAACKYSAPDSPGTMPGDDDDMPGPDSAVPVDVAPLGEWGPPVALDGLNSAQNDDDPTLTGDLLEIYFASTRTPQSADEDIYFATRTSTNEPFGPPDLVPVVNTQFFESNVEISRDGLTLVFSSDRGGNADLYMARRDDRNSPWSEPALIPGVNDPVGGEWGAVITDDLLHIVWCSDRSGNEAIYRADRASAGVDFGAAAMITELDTAANECDAQLPDANTIYFTRSMGNAADLDIFEASNDGSAFAAPVRLTALATAGRDGDPWVSADQRTMVFASNRGTGAGPDDLYITTR